MPYSLVGTPALGYDLARSTHGHQAAVVVRTALRCTVRDLQRLSLRHRGAGAVQPPALGERSRLSSRLGKAGEALRRAQAGDLAGSAELLGQLETAPLGGLAAADRFLRHEVLGWCWTGAVDLESTASLAADVLRDAAAPAFAPDLDPRERRLLALPFLGAGVALVDDEAGTGHDGVDAILARLRTTDPARRRRWREETDAARGTSATWAPAMHEATWALHLSERLRLAADAQMAAVLAFRSAGFEPRDAAYGVWNAVSGAVQAAVVADLLPQADRDVLLSVWRRVHPDSD